jgi:hypothetical protein
LAKKYNKYLLPNNFLGIKEEMISEYENLPIESQCALRWKSHIDRIDKLENKLGDKLLILDYESLIKNTKPELNRLKDFLKLQKDIPFPEIREESLVKWKINLSKKQVENIDTILK